MTPLEYAYSAALLHFVWQGSLVGVALWIALRILTRRAANLRYIICCGALFLMAALPVATTIFFYRSGATAHGVAARIVEHGPAMFSSTPITPVSHTYDWYAMVQFWAVPVWSVGVLFFSARIAWGCRQVTLLRRHGQAAGRDVLSMVDELCGRLGITQMIRVLTSSRTTSPSVVGWLRPVILIPASAITGLSPLQLEAVLAHELAHVRRHDYLVNLLQMAVEALLFYHQAAGW